MKISVLNFPYDLEQELFPYDSVNFPKGLTVLVSRNGSGKTTLINRIEEVISKRKGYKLIKFNNYAEGGDTALSIELFHGNMETASYMWCASEGERIYVNMGKIVQKIGHAAKEMLAESKKGKLVVLLDAIDSGLDVSNIAEMKDVFKMIQKDFEDNGNEIYIIASANEYEMANGERCLDVTTGKFINFDSYDEYRDFILAQSEKR